ncbi:MAG TPA: hypothetical protein PLE93_09140 [Solirubrobacterales bacterium]|nr:hypothetical protein [Solirubrobacterales bacterium]
MVCATWTSCHEDDLPHALGQCAPQRVEVLARDHARAYRYFGRALLVSILVTRVFVFIESQFAAVFGLALDLVLFAAISELASQDEKTRFRFGGLGQADLAEAGSTPEKPSRSQNP